MAVFMAMKLKVVFDRKVDVLHLLTCEEGETSASLAGLEDVVDLRRWTVTTSSVSKS